MNLALDASYSLGPELSGVGVYCREMLQGLAAAHPAQPFRWLYRPHRFGEALRTQAPRNISRGLLLDSFGSRAGLFHGLNQRLPKRRFRYQIATFHDLFVLTGAYSTAEFRERFAGQARYAAAEADCLIAVSQFTADQIHRLLGVERSRIRVIHHGILPRPRVSLPREKIVLSVGALQQRKNTSRLIEAFRALSDEWHLVLAGGAGFGAERLPTAPRVTITGYLPEDELQSLYNRASIFAFPSLDEGFGMPILEAMAAQIPVITSNRSAMPEVAGDAALLVDPMETDDIAAALQRLSLDEELRSALIRKGTERVRQFSWDRAVRATWSVYEELTSLPRPQF